MSEQEQDLVLGRFLREHGEAKRKLTAMAAQLEQYSQAFKSLASCLSHNVHDDFNLQAVTRDISKLPLASFDFAKLLEFLGEYTELRKSVTSGKAKLRELGIDAV